MLVQTVSSHVFWFYTEKDVTGCDSVEQERKQEISGAAIFSTDVIFPLAADPSLVLVSPWLQVGSFFLLLMSISQIGLYLTSNCVYRPHHFCFIMLKIYKASEQIAGK